jgi:hypothetical protein
VKLALWLAAYTKGAALASGSPRSVAGWPVLFPALGPGQRKHSIVITTRLSLPHPSHSCETRRGHIQRTPRYDPGGGG